MLSFEKSEYVCFMLIDIFYDQNRSSARCVFKVLCLYFSKINTRGKDYIDMQDIMHLFANHYWKIYGTNAKFVIKEFSVHEFVKVNDIPNPLS